MYGLGGMGKGRGMKRRRKREEGWGEEGQEKGEGEETKGWLRANQNSLLRTLLGLLLLDNRLGTGEGQKGIPYLLPMSVGGMSARNTKAMSTFFIQGAKKKKFIRHHDIIKHLGRERNVKSSLEGRNIIRDSDTRSSFVISPSDLF